MCSIRKAAGMLLHGNKKSSPSCQTVAICKTQAQAAYCSIACSDHMQ
uniref:Uncharacterized protein n=1 Tax=Arundo donax TaxID=35708 RepID=A0A0A8YQX2_ARUDO